MLATRDPVLFVPSSLLLLLALLVSLGLFAAHASRLYRYLRLGRPEDRTDQPGERWNAFLAHVIAQGRMFREPHGGVMHAVIFWGFLIITVNTAELLLGGLIPGLTFGPLTANPVYLLLLDLFELGVLIAVGVAFYRRLVLRPKRLSFTGDALLILTLISSLMITALLATGFRIAYEPLPLDVWSPVSAAIAVAAQGIDAPTQLALHRVFWWAHILTVLGFLAYLPHSKHLHIVTAPFNVWFRSTRPRGQLPYFDVEKALEEEQPLGASDITHFTWKHLLDTYTCTECGRCEAACPASQTGKPLSPKKLVLDLKDYLIERGPQLTANGDGSNESTKRMVGEVITDEVLWDCVTCRACMQECPVFIEHVPKIIEMRRHLVMEESRFEPEAQRLFDNLEATGNPWRQPRVSRADWAKGMDIPTMAESPELEYLYWVGCAGSHDERNMKVARSFAGLMQRAGVKFAILGTEESCTGDPARRAGHEFLFQTLAQQNVETLNGYGVKKIVTSCPHCFNTLKNEYPQLGGSYEVVHHSQFLRDLIEAGKLLPMVEHEQAVAYHDPCYLGRYNEIYDQPRGVLQKIPGLEVREVPGCNRDRAMCCGGGGARVFMDEKRGNQRINHRRIDQAMEAQPQTIATACPYCIIMLEDGARARGVYDDVPVADISELLARSVKEEARGAAPGA